jgi:hypothetical protein
MVMQGSPPSPGPQIAFNFTKGAVRSRLSSRTWTPKRTSRPAARPMAHRSIQHRSQSRPASSWPMTPGDTVTQRSCTALVSPTGYLIPASRATAETSTSTPSAMAWARL